MQSSTTTTDPPVPASEPQFRGMDKRTQDSVQVLIETLSALGYDISKDSPQHQLAYNEQDAATQLSISPRTLFTLRKEGKIRAVRVGNRVIYPREELQRFLASSAE